MSIKKRKLKTYNLIVKDDQDIILPRLKLYEMEDAVKEFLEEPDGITSLEVVKLRKDIKKLQEKNKKLRKGIKKLQEKNKKLRKENKELEEHYNRFDILDL